jgi:hypothetical protein
MTEAIVDKGSRFNSMTLIFVVVTVVVTVHFVVSMAALIFPDLGLPFMWTAFPIAPQGPPISPESLLPTGG